jgi:hypothetical protein
LTGEDILWQADGEAAQKWRRIWIASEQKDGGGMSAPPKMKLILSETFQGGGDTTYTLVLYSSEP